MTKVFYQVSGTISRSFSSSVCGDYSHSHEDIAWEKNVDNTMIDTLEAAKDIFETMSIRYENTDDWYGDLTIYLIECTCDEEDGYDENAIQTFEITKYLSDK